MEKRPTEIPNPGAADYSSEKKLNTQIDIERILSDLVADGRISQRDLDLFLDYHGYRRPKMTLRALAAEQGLAADGGRVWQINKKTREKLAFRLKNLGYGEGYLSPAEPAANESTQTEPPLAEVRRQILETLENPANTEPKHDDAPEEPADIKTRIKVWNWIKNIIK